MKRTQLPGFASLTTVVTIGLFLVITPILNADETVDSLVDGLLDRRQAVQTATFTYEYGVISKVQDLDLPLTWNPDRHDEGYLTIAGEEWVCRRKKNSNKMVHRVTYDAIHSSGRSYADEDIRHTLELQSPSQSFQETVKSDLCFQIVLAGIIPWDELVDYLDTHREKLELKGQIQVDSDDTWLLEVVVPVEDRTALNSYRGGMLEDPDDPITVHLYVIPEKGYVLRRMEYLNKDGQWGNRFDSRDFRETAQGIFFPWEFYVIRNSRDFGKKSGFLVDQFKVISVERVNEPVPESEFEIDLPRGTKVYDDRTESAAVFTTSDLTPLSRIDELIQQSEESQIEPVSADKFKIFIIILNLVVLGFFVVLFVRKKLATSHS